MHSLDGHRTTSSQRGAGWQALRSFIALWENPITSALLAVALYAAISASFGLLWRTSPYAYYNYLADALLHGQLHLRLLPQTTHDLSLYGGRYYPYWPPFPAILLMPFIALFGVGFNDTVFTIGVAGLNVGLIALLLRQACKHGIVELGNAQRGLLVLFFAFGTVHLPLAPFGSVWFTGQLVAFGCVAVAYLAAISLRGTPAFVLTGLAVAAALLTRNHLLFAGLWPAYYLIRQHWPEGRARLIRYVGAGLTPVVLAVATLAVYNWLRFGDPRDSGLDYHQMASILRAGYERYGVFSLHYVPTNLYYQYLAYPLPFGPESVMGGSLFLLSPLFFAAIWGLIVGRPRPSTLVLGTTVLAVAIPTLLFMGTGWVQWGPRFTLDFTVPLLLLVALGIQQWSLIVIALLTLISIVHYAIGTVYLATNT